MIVIIVVAIVVLVAVLVVGSYNQLVTLRNRFKNAFAQIDVQLKRRHDLIPNLVEATKGYMKHEREVLQAVTEARSAASGALQRARGDPTDAGAVTALVAAERALGGALGRFLVLQEAYPDLKANQTVSQLMEELSSTENRIAFARQAYNDAVMRYETKRQVFPANLVASSFAFGPAAYFEIEEEGERAVPDAKLS